MTPALRPPGLPYASNVGRLWKIFDTGLANPALPQEVADVILNAITTDQPKLRYPVGRYAEPLAAMLNTLSAEEELALMGEADDVTFWREPWPGPTPRPNPSPPIVTASS